MKLPQALKRVPSWNAGLTNKALPRRRKEKRAPVAPLAFPDEPVKLIVFPPQRLQSAMPPTTEPALTTDWALLEILETLKARKPIFYRPELGVTQEVFEAMTMPDFSEIGAFGRPYSRDYVLSELEKRYAGPYVDRWETQDFYCRHLAGDVYLLTDTLFQGERQTRRTSIWRKSPTGCKIVFHQGTVVQDT